MTNKKDHLYGASTAPGRIRAYFANKEAGHNDLLPYSCKLRKYANYLPYELSRTSKDLRWGAGVKLVLDDYKVPSPCNMHTKWYFKLSESHPDYNKITEHQKRFLYNPTIHSPQGTCPTTILVGDFMERDDIDFCFSDKQSIEDSWNTFWEYLNQESTRTLVVDLSALRPCGSTNGRGLTSTGAVGDGTEESNTASFLAIYEFIALYAQTPSIANFIKLFGVLNNTIRRGGLYKNGIVCSSMHYQHPLIWDYLSIPLVDIAGSHKKAVGIDKNLLLLPALRDKVLEGVKTESVFLEKREYSSEITAFPNVCVSGNTWVDTLKGAKQVKSLVGKPFDVIVNNAVHRSTSEGFWSTGEQNTVRLTTQSGLNLELTPNHKVIKATRKNYDSAWCEEWVEVQSLIPGDRVKLANNQYSWDGQGSFNQGWLVGNLIGDGFFATKTSALLLFYGDYRDELINIAQELLLDEPPVCRSGSTTPCPMSASADKWAEGRSKPFRTIGGRRLGNLALNWGLTREFKHNLEKIEQDASSDFCRGLISGLFDADSHVGKGQNDGAGESIQFTQVADSVVYPVVRILNRLGIATNIWKNPPRQREIRGQVFDCQESTRIDITGRHNLALFADRIGFKHPGKDSALKALLSDYQKAADTRSQYTKVLSVSPAIRQEVYDCTIPSLGYFTANGLIAHNCVGLFVPDDGTCLIWRVNYGMCESPEDIVQAYKDTAQSLASLHLSWRNDNPGKASYSAPLEEDRQIGLDVMGLANYLALHNITYEQFINAVDYCLEVTDYCESSLAKELVMAIIEGQQEAVKICDALTSEAGLPPLDRIFCVEPAQSHSYETFDLSGRTTCRGIWPPLGRRVNFDSDTRANHTVMHGMVETVTTMSEDTYEAIHERFQLLLNASGRPHTISYDLRREPTIEWLEKFIDSPLKTKYYTELGSTDQSYLQKTIQTVKS